MVEYGTRVRELILVDSKYQPVLYLTIVAKTKFLSERVNFLPKDIKIKETQSNMQRNILDIFNFTYLML